MNEEQNQYKKNEKENKYDYKQQNQEKECDLKSDIRDKDREEYWSDHGMDDFENEMDDAGRIKNFIIEISNLIYRVALVLCTARP